MRLPKTAFGHAELGELRGDGLAMRRRAHQSVNVENPAIHADVERPSRRKRLVGVNHAVGQRDVFIRITQERIVDAQRLRESLVRVGVVNADGEVGDVERPYLIATLTE